MMISKFIVKQNDGKHIHDIVNRTTCNKHNAEKGNPCFKVYYDSPCYGINPKDHYGFAICGQRVIKSGFNGKINQASLSRMTKNK